VTNIGDGITLAAGPLLVASQTRNPLAVAMATLGVRCCRSRTTTRTCEPASQADHRRGSAAGMMG
jgi:hypothetical protein